MEDSIITVIVQDEETRKTTSFSISKTKADLSAAEDLGDLLVDAIQQVIKEDGIKEETKITRKIGKFRGYKTYKRGEPLL